MTGSSFASKLRSFVISIVSIAALLGLTQFVFPGSGDGKGTPGAVIFSGLVLGLIGALVAAGIVLVYRTTRIINFAQASIGAAGGVFTYWLVVAETTHWPFLPAFVAGVIVAGIIGLGVEIAFVRRFFNAPRLVLTVVTIALIQGLGFAAGFVQNLPIFGDVRERSLDAEQGVASLKLPFGDFQFHVGRLGLQFGFAHLFVIGMSILALLGLAAFFRFTKAGVAVRASAENSERAMLLGINVKGLSTLVWTITGVLSGIGVILTGMIGSFGGLSGAASGPQAAGAIVIALAAAVLAKMRSLPTVVVAAVGLQLAKQAIQWSFPNQVSLFDAGLFGLILVGLLLQRKSLVRSEAAETSSWEATQELRPTPKEMLEVSGVRLWRIVLIVIAVIGVLAFPWLFAAGPTSVAGYVAIEGIVLLSLVVLTGWAGQVSLGQWALVGVGAVVGGALTARFNLTFWLAIPIGIIVTALFAVLIGLPALRIRGLFLAVATFAFAFAVQTNLFNQRYFGAILPRDVERPRLFLFDFDEERSMYYLIIAALLLAILVVTTLRRSRPGRILIALRENEPNLESFGVNLVRTRLAAFALSGGLAGFAGVLLAAHQHGVSSDTFPASESLQIFIFAIIGGIGSVSGAILGVGYLVLNRVFATNQLLQLIIGPVGVLLILYSAPGGLSSIAFGLRDGVYRIIAQRRRMVVPSLFADVDPDSLTRQLAPLAEALPSAGLSVIPANLRYRTESWLYGGRRGLAAAARRASVDAAAFEAAAGSESQQTFGAGTESVAAATGESGEVAGNGAGSPANERPGA